MRGGGKGGGNAGVPLICTYTSYSVVRVTVIAKTDTMTSLPFFGCSRRFSLKMFIASAGTLSASHRTDPCLLPRSLRGTTCGVALVEVKHSHRTSIIHRNNSNSNNMNDDSASAFTQVMDQKEAGGTRKSALLTKEDVEPTDRSEVRGVTIQQCICQKHKVSTCMEDTMHEMFEMTGRRSQDGEVSLQ